MAGPLIVSDRDNGRIDLGDQQANAAFLVPDETWVKDGGLSQEQVLRFLTDIHYEPQWRKSADIDADYFDGHQLSQEVLDAYERRGMPPLVINLIQPLINSVLGMEAKTRSDCEVTFDDDASEQVATALNKKMNDAQRNAYTDRATSEAYAGQVKAGLGWVEVADNPHPLQYKYRVGSVHRREIWWDWRDTDPALDNARWLVRKKWYDDDMLKKILPHLAGLIGGAMSPIDSSLSVIEHASQSTGLGMSNDLERAVSLEFAEWRDSERARSILYEVWYRVWTESFVVRLPNDKVVEVDQSNYDQMALIATGMVRPKRVMWPKMRQAFFLGPHRILDRWSPLPHQSFPYIPFWGFREDLSAMPYGLIRAMRSPQDEINARRSRMMALLSARRVRIDSDAVNESYNSLREVSEQASSHNYFIVTNPKRLNRQGAIEIDSNMDLSVAQMEVLRESKEELHQVSGIFSVQQGEKQPGMSGVALNSLVDQGTTTLAEVNDNYRFARRLTHERLFDHVKRDSVHQHKVVVGEGTARKEIWLNQRAPDSPAIINDVQLSTAKVVLQDVPSTATYRQQQFMLLAEMTKALPPEIQQFVIDFVIEASDRPERKKVAARLRKALNMPEPGAEGEEQQQLPPAVQQQLQEQQLIIQELGEKLAKAMNAVELENAKHLNRMEELDREAEIDRMKHGQAIEATNTKAAAQATAAAAKQPSGGSGTGAADSPPGNVDANGELVEVVRELAAEVEDLKAKTGPKRSIVTDLGDGKYSVLSVPVQQQLPLPPQPSAQPGAPA